MPARLPETTRLETFCDGVFAIAITLLVLGIQVPTAALALLYARAELSGA